MMDEISLLAQFSSDMIYGSCIGDEFIKQYKNEKKKKRNSKKNLHLHASTSSPGMSQSLRYQQKYCHKLLWCLRVRTASFANDCQC